MPNSNQCPVLKGELKHNLYQVVYDAELFKSAPLQYVDKSMSEDMMHEMKESMRTELRFKKGTIFICIKGISALDNWRPEKYETIVYPRLPFSWAKENLKNVHETNLICTAVICGKSGLEYTVVKKEDLENAD